MSDPIGKFEILAQLGRGANSTIVKIRRASDSKIYALKIIPIESADDQKYIVQAEHEFDVAQNLDHPNLVKVYAIHHQKNLLFRTTGVRLLLEYVDGQPLAKCTQLPLLRLVMIFHRAADALAHMHEKGFFHADIKPDNIMVTTDADVKIIDFGLAWREGEKKDRVQGTLEFLAPEQAKRKIVNARTDIFNFGATMYRVFSRSPVPGFFRELGSSRVGKVDDLLPSLVSVNPTIPAELDQLVRHCMKYKALERPSSMKDVRRRLKAIGKELHDHAGDAS